MSRKQESGQVFVLAALSMMVLIGIAAFCVNASFMFYQHQRMQGMVDEQTRLAAGSGCSAVTNNNFDGGTLVISSTVITQPFYHQNGYCEGFYTKDPRGLFGNLLRFPNNISVHAIALHGGTSEANFALLGLSTNGLKAGCSVYFEGSENVTINNGPIFSNSSTPYDPADSSSCAKKPATLNGGSYYLNNAAKTDPYRVAVPSTGPAPTSNTAASDMTICGYTVPKGATYYQPQSTSSGIALVSKVSTSGKQVEVYLPYCDLSGNKTPGIYLIDPKGGINPSGGTIISHDSMFVLESDTASGNQANIQITGGTIDWNSIEDGVYGGYAVYESNNCWTPKPTQGVPMSFNGGGDVTINGLMDLSCGDIGLAGTSKYTVNGAIVGYTVDFSGSSGSTATLGIPPVPPVRGAFLVQ